MKYANIKFSGKEINNLGDQAQIIALNRMYKRLGINKTEIVDIPLVELSTYHGDEKVLLPVLFPILTWNQRGICGLFSDSIVPVFIGFTWLSPVFNDDEIKYLKSFEPIGCRDEYTRNNLIKYGIDAYLNGCITLSAFFDHSNYNTVGGKRLKYYLVDVEEAFLPYIPDFIKEKAEVRSQYILAEKGADIYEIAYRRYEEYNKEAKLVITSRLHCAIPCISMGIPVILLRERVSYRFSWVEKLISIYTLDSVNMIDWNPKPILCDDLVDLQIKNFYNALHGKKTSLPKTIDAFLMDRNKNSYYVEGINPAIDYIKSCTISEGTYIIWGGSVAAQCIYDIITRDFPALKMIRLVDKYNKIRIGNCESCSFEEVNENEWTKSLVFVTALAANSDASSLFKRIGKTKDVIYCYV